MQYSDWVIIVLLSLLCLFLSFVFTLSYNAYKREQKRVKSYENTLLFFAHNEVFYVDPITLDPVKCSDMAKTTLYFNRKRKKLDDMNIWHREINRDFSKEY